MSEVLGWAALILLVVFVLWVAGRNNVAWSDFQATIACCVCGAEEALYLHARCHPRSPTWAVLTGDVLTIECAECQTVVVQFRITGTQPSRAQGEKEGGGE